MSFMEKALARREVNRKVLDQYVLDETETFEILGPGRWPLHRTKREFTWYEQDGMHVRSPVRFDGVAVGEEPRREYEARWIRRERERQERKAKNEREKGSVTHRPARACRSTPASAVVPTEPRFVSEAYFMDFKFEPGNYYLAGREKLEGHDVLRIEYYPTNLFNDDDDEKTPREIKKKPSGREQRREDKIEQDIDRKMNKTALVTLWVDPAEHQIVKYTFDNVWLDFLPGAWLVRIDDLRASMTMGQPFPGVWLPRGMNIHAGLTLAAGSFEAGYGRTFSEYRAGGREDEDQGAEERRLRLILRLARVLRSLRTAIEPLRLARGLTGSLRTLRAGGRDHPRDPRARKRVARSTKTCSSWPASRSAIRFRQTR